MVTDLAYCMRLLRRQRGLTLDALASRIGRTKSYLSKLESGRNAPSIATALKLADAFGIPLGTLLGQGNHDDLLCVVRANERVPLERRGSRADYRHEAIAAGRAVKLMQPFVIRPPSRFAREHALAEHQGEELIFVLKGRIEVEFPNRHVELAGGDSIYFDSQMPHRLRSLGPVQAEALVVIASIRSAPQRRRR
ncbi:MAG: helix-turn-helix transcriptional regulator [Burkholderiales bacterium]|nr:helix-turn-helix transcriptional regulator [Burkholderiales bacterium]